MDIASCCPKNIVLIGFMGCGKSTVGRILAKRSGRYFLDTDALIESFQDRAINAIFKESGLKYFRALERESTEWIAECVRGAVISTGGGMPLVAERIKDMGDVIYLKLSFDEIIKRVMPEGREKRPLLKDIDEVRDIYKNREKIYKEIADFTVDASKSPEFIADEIIKYLSLAID